MVWFWIIAYLVVAALSIFTFGYVDGELSGEDGPGNTVLIDLAAGFFWPLGWTIWAPVLALGWVSRKQGKGKAEKSSEKGTGDPGPWSTWIPTPSMDDMYRRYYMCGRCGYQVEVSHGTDPAEAYPFCKCGAKMKSRGEGAKQ